MSKGREDVDCQHNSRISDNSILNENFNNILVDYNNDGNKILLEPSNGQNNFINGHVNLEYDSKNQRDSEKNDPTENDKSDLSGLIKLSKENPNNPSIAYLK